MGAVCVWHSFCVERGPSRIQFYVDRQEVDAVGDLEYPFFSATTGVARHSANLASLLLERPTADSVPIVVTVRNPRIVFDPEFVDRLESAIALLASLGDSWSVASPHGLAPTGEIVSSIYSSVGPTLPAVRTPQPLVDTAADLLVINGAFLARLQKDGVTFADDCLEQALLIQGYLARRVAVFLPELAIPLAGPLLGWAGSVAIEGLKTAFFAVLGDQTLPTLHGPLSLATASTPSPAGPRPQPFVELVNAAIAPHCLPLSLSIVTRTRFNRPHLLHRMLTSVARSGPAPSTVEVVLSTDIEEDAARKQFEELEELFPALELRLRVNQIHEHSRIGNLLGGVDAATRDWIAFVDDDDYIDLTAFRELALSTFLGVLPLVFMANVLHEEEWSQTPSGRHVLARSTPKYTYPSAGWRQMFSGVNQLPISAMIIPREALLRRLKSFDFRHDLSEDYILALLVLTDPALPPIAELRATFVHISSRPGQDNTITMVDRRPWVRDITLFLADLLGNEKVAGPGMWQLLRGLAEQVRPTRDDVTIRNLQEIAAKQRRDLHLLSLEVRRLTGMLATLD